jgi:hypothetical protein
MLITTYIQSHFAHVPIIWFGEMRNAHKILVREPEGKRPLGKTRNVEENIKVNGRKIACEGVDWIHMAEDRGQKRVFVNILMRDGRFEVFRAMKIQVTVFWVVMS